jgi:hypothetical protein
MYKSAGHALNTKFHSPSIFFTLLQYSFNLLQPSTAERSPAPTVDKFFSKNQCFWFWGKMYYIHRLKTTSSNTLTHTASSTIPLSFIMVIMIKELRQTGGWLWRGVLLHKRNVSGLVLSLSKVFHTERERGKSAGYVFRRLFVPLYHMYFMVGEE